MKRIAQFAAALALALFVVEPALAGLPCAFGLPAACAPDCPMLMSGMGADCPMAGPMAASDCPQNCCAHAVAQAIATVVAAENLKTAAHTTALATPIEVGTTRLAAAHGGAIGARVESPPLYLLNQVFRI